MAGQKLTTAEFVEKATIVHGDVYDYTKVEYLNSRNKVIIICTKCNIDFKQKASNHLQGQGCPKCNKKNTKLTQNEFIDRCTNLHGHKYDYSKVVLRNLRTDITIICNMCNNEFNQRAKNHMDGNGCPQCGNHSFMYDKPAILYYIPINKGEAYKIGITNNTVNKRFSADSSVSIDVIATWYYDIGKDAYNKEQSILQEFNNAKLYNSNLLLTGNTELFSYDILGLENS